MSFGFSIGDFILIANLAKDSVEGCKKAPADFIEAGRGAESLHIVLSGCQNEVERADSIFQTEKHHADEFTNLLKNCKVPLDRLDFILAKLPSLSGPSPKLIERFRIPRKDLLDIGRSLGLHTSYLATFLNTIGLISNSRLEELVKGLRDSNAQLETASRGLVDSNAQILDSTSRIEATGSRVESLQVNSDKKLNDLLAAVEKLGRSTTATVLSDHSHDDKPFWRQLRSDLQDQGFTSGFIEANAPAIRTRLDKLIKSGLWGSESSQAPASLAGTSHDARTRYRQTNYKSPAIRTIAETSVDGDEHDDNASIVDVPRAEECQNRRSSDPPNQRLPNVLRKRTLSIAQAPIRLFIAHVDGIIDLAGEHTPGLVRQVSNQSRKSTYLSSMASTARVCLPTPKKFFVGQRTRVAPPWRYRKPNDFKKPENSKTLLASLFDPTSSALSIAARKGRLDEVVSLLRNGHSTEAHEVKIQRNSDTGEKKRIVKNPPLYNAAVGNYFTIAHELLKYGANPDCWAPLDECIEHDSLSMVQLLLEYGATPSPDALRAAVRNDSEVCSQLLLNYNADINSPNFSGKSPLHIAAENGCTKLVSLLLSEGARVSPRDSKELTPLWRASERGHTKAVKLLLQYGADPNMRNLRPLYNAIVHDYPDIVESLLAYGADPNKSQGPHGEVSLSAAVLAKSKRMVMALLVAGARPTKLDRKGLTPLSEAVQKGYISIVETLLLYGAEPDVGGEMGQTPLFIASWDGRIRIVDLLLQAGADPSLQDVRGATPLYKACGRGFTNVVQLLLLYGADPSAGCGSAGETPMYKAARAGHLAIVEALLAAGADPDIENGTKPGAAGNATDKLLWLLRPLEDPKNEYRLRPLHAAASFGYLDIVKTLVDAGADIHARRPGGTTPMYAAAARQHKDVVEWLLSRGAELEDPRVVDPVARLMTEGELEHIEGLGSLTTDASLSTAGCLYQRIAASHGGDGLKAMQTMLMGNQRPKNLSEVFAKIGSIGELVNGISGGADSGDMSDFEKMLNDMLPGSGVAAGRRQLKT